RLHSITKEANCVRLLNETDSCPNCFLAEENNYTVNAIVFYAKYRTEVMVFKGMFSVPKKDASERRFYWYWEVVTFKYQYFCLRMVLSLHTTFLRIKKKQCRQNILRIRYRQVERSMVFNTTGDKNVSCFSPLKKSKDWITKTRMVQVEDAFPLQLIILLKTRQNW
ncbi:Methyl-CpG-binding protein 2, partial [Orchesella cincta]